MCKTCPLFLISHFAFSFFSRLICAGFVVNTSYVCECVCVCETQKEKEPAKEQMRIGGPGLAGYVPLDRSCQLGEKYYSAGPRSGASETESAGVCVCV